MWDDPGRMRALAVAVATVAGGLLCFGLLAWVVRQPVFAWREVVVTSRPERVRPADIEAVVREELVGNFFTMQLDRTRAALGRVPWIRKVGLRRQWPHRLEIDIEEHVPLARWNDQGLVNTEGEVFAAEFDGDLPSFVGPEGRAPEVLSRYREWGSVLAPLGLALRGVEMSARGGWRLMAMRGSVPLTIELGRDDVPGRLDRFVAAHGRTIGFLARNGTQVDHVDLRYRNGFAARVPGFKEKPPKRT